jgi:hypothetical protein
MLLGKLDICMQKRGISNPFLNSTLMAQQLREGIDKWDYMKFKSFHKIKEMINRLKRQPTEWKKIFASCISDKGLITRKYRELKTQNS